MSEKKEKNNIGRYVKLEVTYSNIQTESILLSSFVNY